MDGPKNDAIGTVEPYISFPTGTEYMGQIKDKIVCIDGTSKDLIIADTSGTSTSTKIAPQDVIIMGEVICAEDHDGNYHIVELDEDIFSMIDIDGKQIYDPIKMEGYSSTGEFANGLFEVVDSTWKSNLASFTGEILLQSSVYVLDYKYPVWETENGCYIPMNDEFVSGYLTDVYNNSFTIDNGLSCSLYDINTGKILLVLPKIFPFSEGYAKAQNEDGYWGYINSRGEWVIPAQFESASDIKNGVGFVDTGERCGLIKLSG